MTVMREIVFDTETTGLRPQDGERIIEIGAVELENRFLTGRTFHTYLNPEDRAVHPDAENVHGLSDQFLADKPVFSAIVADFLAFVGDAKLVAHNAAFDMGFLNAELSRIGAGEFDPARVIDTLSLARRKHPMGPNSLDALCQRYGIDNSRRQKHGALLDSELLAEVYIELNGGRQASMLLDTAKGKTATAGNFQSASSERLIRPVPLAPRLNEADLDEHRRFVAGLGETAIWNRYS